MTTTQELFKQAVKGKNVMTPDVIRYGQTGKHVFELSEGTGFDGQPIYGVTVVNIEGEPKHDTNKSEMFYSREFAEAYIGDLR